MPDLYYGPYDEDPNRRLYTPGMARVTSSVFDNFRVVGLAPYPKGLHLCNIWWWRRKKHTILSWHGDIVDPAYFAECTVLIPAQLNQRDALEYARTIFPEVMPSAITFRFRQEYDEVLLYD